jgi:hypothetical protein
MPLVPTKTLVQDGCKPCQFPDLAKTRAARFRGGVNLAAGQVLGEVQVAVANEVQTITLGGTPNGGTFTLLYPAANGGSYDAAGPIAWHATGATLAANIQAALDALFGAAQVVVTGTGPFTLTYSGDTVKSRDVPQPIAINNLTGTTPTVTPATTTPGSAGLVGVMDAYNDALTDGTQVARAILRMPVRTAPDGTIVDEFGSPAGYTSEVWVSGDFLASELLGLDTNGVGDLGKLISGSAFSVAGAILRIGV